MESTALALYLSRVGLPPRSEAHPLPPTRETLTRLLVAHHHAVPFENLDLYLGVRPSLEPDAVFDKLVVRRRGGWCCEHAFLFERVLRALGYSVRRVAGQVWLAPPATGLNPPGTHAMLLVDLIDDVAMPLLVDPGFPRTVADAPLDVSEAALGLVQQMPSGAVIKLTRDAKGWITRHSQTATGDWLPEWIYDTLAPTLNSDLLEAGHAFVYNDDVSVFRRSALMTLPRHGGGRLTLSGLQRIETDAAGGKTASPIDRAAWTAALRDEFGVAPLAQELFAADETAAERPPTRVLASNAECTGTG